jgi:ribosomal protein S18 acetylase RimI-like enzyme
VDIVTLAASPGPQAVRLPRDGIARLAQRLEHDFGQVDLPMEGVVAHQFLLDALDRGEHRAMTVWPTAEEPQGVCYVGAGGLIVPGGVPGSASPLAAAVRSSGWRVLVGDLEIGRAIVEDAGAGLFRRRPYAREQRLMVADRRSPAPSNGGGLRRASSSDLDVLTDFACGLHVEDQMGPPLSRGGRSSVRQRVSAGIRRGTSWVVEAEGRVVAKIDVSIESHRRGAQLAGVYVEAAWRGRGVARRGIAALTSRLLDAGMPFVTLHVRADNTPAIHAYEAAGFAQRRRWLLALR